MFQKRSVENKFNQKAKACTVMFWNRIPTKTDLEKGGQGIKREGNFPGAKHYEICYKVSWSNAVKTMKVSYKYYTLFRKVPRRHSKPSRRKVFFCLLRVKKDLGTQSFLKHKNMDNNYCKKKACPGKKILSLRGGGRRWCIVIHKTPWLPVPCWILGNL